MDSFDLVDLLLLHHVPNDTYSINIYILKNMEAKKVAVAG